MCKTSEYVAAESARLISRRKQSLAKCADAAAPAWELRAHRRIARQVEERIAYLADCWIASGGVARLPRSL